MSDHPLHEVVPPQTAIPGIAVLPFDRHEEDGHVPPEIVPVDPKQCFVLGPRIPVSAQRSAAIIQGHRASGPVRVFGEAQPAANCPVFSPSHIALICNTSPLSFDGRRPIAQLPCIRGEQCECRTQMFTLADGSFRHAPKPGVRMLYPIEIERMRTKNDRNQYAEYAPVSELCLLCTIVNVTTELLKNTRKDNTAPRRPIQPFHVNVGEGAFDPRRTIMPNQYNSAFTQPFPKFAGQLIRIKFLGTEDDDYALDMSAYYGHIQCRRLGSWFPHQLTADLLSEIFCTDWNDFIFYGRKEEGDDVPFQPFRLLPKKQHHCEILQNPEYTELCQRITGLWELLEPESVACYHEDNSCDDDEFLRARNLHFNLKYHANRASGQENGRRRDVTWVRDGYDVEPDKRREKFRRVHLLADFMNELVLAALRSSGHVSLTHTFTEHNLPEFIEYCGGIAINNMSMVTQLRPFDPGYYAEDVLVKLLWKTGQSKCVLRKIYSEIEPTVSAGFGTELTYIFGTMLLGNYEDAERCVVHPRQIALVYGLMDRDDAVANLAREHKHIVLPVMLEFVGRMSKYSPPLFNLASQSRNWDHYVKVSVEIMDRVRNVLNQVHFTLTDAVTETKSCKSHSKRLNHIIRGDPRVHWLDAIICVLEHNLPPFYTQYDLLQWFTRGHITSLRGFLEFMEVDQPQQICDIIASPRSYKRMVCQLDKELVSLLYGYFTAQRLYSQFKLSPHTQSLVDPLAPDCYFAACYHCTLLIGPVDDRYSQVMRDSKGEVLSRGNRRIKSNTFGVCQYFGNRFDNWYCDRCRHKLAWMNISGHTLTFMDIAIAQCIVPGCRIGATPGSKCNRCEGVYVAPLCNRSYKTTLIKKLEEQGYEHAKIPAVSCLVCRRKTGKRAIASDGHYPLATSDHRIESICLCDRHDSDKVRELYKVENCPFYDTTVSMIHAVNEGRLIEELAQRGTEQIPEYMLAQCINHDYPTLMAQLIATGVQGWLAQDVEQLHKKWYLHIGPEEPVTERRYKLARACVMQPAKRKRSGPSVFKKVFKRGRQPLENAGAHAKRQRTDNERE